MQLADQEKRIAELEDAETLGRPVHPEVRRLRRIVQELRTTIEQKNTELRQLQAQLEEGGEASQEIQNRLERQETLIKKLKDQRSRLREQLQQAQKLTDERKRKLDQLQTQLKDVKEAEATQVGGEVTITLDESILFKLGEADLKDDAKTTLNKLTDVFQKHSDYRILVEGHTDDVPVGGSRFSSNWELSVERAANVVEYLQENSSIAGNRFMAAGLGPYDPVAPNDTPKNRAKNRRVEIKLIPIGHLKKEGQSPSDTTPAAAPDS